MSRTKPVLVITLLILGTISGVVLVVSPDANGETDPAFEFEFTEVSNQTGFRYVYDESAASDSSTDTNPSVDMTVTNAGIYASDYDRDGWTDILATGGERPVLFENTDGTFSRSRVLPPINRSVTGALFFDYNQDGWDDLLLLLQGERPLLLKNVEGRYEPRDVGFETTLAIPTGATTGDYDRDGCPDLFVIQNGNWNDRLPNGIKGYNAPVNDDNGNPNYLYYGNCSGPFTFERANQTAIRGNRWSLATSSADLTGDGWTDIHVANDYNRDILYLNQGNGSFRQVVLQESTNRNGMASELFDVNGDRRLDIFVTNIFYPDFLAQEIASVLVSKGNGNTLLINSGNRTFSEQARQYSVAKGGWGWAAVVADFENDGDEDLFHATQVMNWRRRMLGLSNDAIEDLREMSFYSYPVLRESGNGTFHEINVSAAGFEPANGRGAIRLDYDRDGDIDIVVATKSSYLLYENTGRSGKAIQLRVENTAGVPAFGAEVFVTAAGTQQWRTVRPFTDFLSQDPRIVHVGVGDVERVDIRVVWPDGTERIFDDVRTDHLLVVSPRGVVERMPLNAENTSDRNE